MIDKITVPSAPIASSPNIQKTMKGNRSVNTVPEILLRKELFRIGFRYRVHYSLPGKPDIVFPSKKIAVFIDGCFWHMCPKCSLMPKTNTGYWTAKLNRNVQRMKEVNTALKNDGWKVIRVWEHEIKSNLASTLDRIQKTVVKN